MQLAEELPIETRLVVVALKIRPTRKLHEVAVAGIGLGQERQVVVELFAFSLVTIVEPPAPDRALVTRFRRHIGLGTNDWFDALLLAGFVEVENAVHVAVVGNPDGGLSVGARCSNDLVDSGRTVEH